MPDTQSGFDSSADDAYKTLLESTRAVPWKIDWTSMQYVYVGPQIKDILGLEPSDWLGELSYWIESIHPDEREAIVNYCVAQSRDGIDHEADYRVLSKDRGYVWIRDVVHVLRNEQGETTALVGFMFDITERKQNEEKLLALQKELEALSFMDGLTGVANRRRFDATLETEWASARRSKQSLTLILLDVDFFKQYNDQYGHLEGDECLKRVAQALKRALVRPRDLVARFGGEEFALILPETNMEAACKVAERCLHLIQEQQIPHDTSSVAACVTVSMGLASVTFPTDLSVTAFLEGVDKLLYKAKQEGRNRIENARF